MTDDARTQAAAARDLRRERQRRLPGQRRRAVEDGREPAPPARQPARDASGQIGSDDRFSGESAKAASTAFSHSAKKMADRADEMRDGARPSPTPHTRCGRRRRPATASRSTRVTSRRSSRRTSPTRAPSATGRPRTTSSGTSTATARPQAGEAITALTDNHTTQAAVFAKIHGEPPPPPPPARAAVARSTRVPRRRPRTCRWVVTRQARPSTRRATTPTTTGNADPGRPRQRRPGQRRPRAARRPRDPPGPDPAPVDAPPGWSATRRRSRRRSGWRRRRGRRGGAVAGGALGGMAAAGLAAGGLNGLVPVGAVAASAAGSRPVACAASERPRAPVRARSWPWHRCCGSSGRRRSGRCRGPSRCRWHCRPQRGRERQPQRGRPRVAGPGGRACAGAGAGAGAGRGGKDKKRQGEERDLFDDGADWIDDEDAAPGLLD